MNFNENELEDTDADIVDSILDIFDDPLVNELRNITSDFVSDFGFDPDYY